MQELISQLERQGGILRGDVSDANRVGAPHTIIQLIAPSNTVREGFRRSGGRRQLRGGEAANDKNKSDDSSLHSSIMQRAALPR